MVMQTYTKDKIDELIDSKQDKLTAGDGITITDNVISAAGGTGGVEGFTVYESTDWTPIINYSSNKTTMKIDAILCVWPTNGYPTQIYLPAGMAFDSLKISRGEYDALTGITDGNKIRFTKHEVVGTGFATQKYIFYTISYGTLTFNFDTSTISSSGTTSSKEIQKKTSASSYGANSCMILVRPSDIPQ